MPHKIGSCWRIKSGRGDVITRIKHKKSLLSLCFFILTCEMNHYKVFFQHKLLILFTQFVLLFNHEEKNDFFSHKTIWSIEVVRVRPNVTTNHSNLVPFCHLCFGGRIRTPEPASCASAGAWSKQARALTNLSHRSRTYSEKWFNL